MALSKLISAKVYERGGVVFEGDVRGISAYNARGQFDVLPVHSNFISVLRKKLVLHQTDGSKRQISIDSGVMRILLNKAVIYIGIK